MKDTTNIIAQDFKHGKNFKIGHHCIIQEGCVFGDHVEIDSFSVIEKGTVIGDNSYIGTFTKIGHNAIIGSNCRFTSYCEIRSNCQLGNSVSMGSRCTLSSGTIVGDDVIIKYGFVATDTPQIGIAAKKTCILKKGSKYGANVTIMPSVVVGVNSEIGACSQVRKDVGDEEVWYGSPAKFFRKTK